MPQFIEWVRSNQDLALDVVRIYLGIALFVRGVLILTDSGAFLEGVGADLDQLFIPAAAMIYVAIAHLFGGALLAIGLVTRIAAIVQLPILVGAVFFVHIQDGLLTAGQSLELAALVLFLLAVITVFGAGRLSADYYLFVKDDARELDDIIFDAIGPSETSPSPSAPAASGGAATATQVKEVTAEKVQTNCNCGNDLNHPRVTVEPRYGTLSGLLFLFGISAPVKEIVFWCEKCDTVMKRSRDPKMLERYRWHTL